MLLLTSNFINLTIFYTCCICILTTECTGTEKEKGKTAVCGYRNKKGAGGQLSGARSGESQFGEFPWMLAIYKQYPGEEKKYRCGASLIHYQVALTAAHCIFDSNPESKFIVRAGVWDLELLVEILPKQDREVKSVKIHPEYLAGALFNDVALLILNTPLNMDEHISTICLPPQGFLLQSGTGFASGWGKIIVDNETTDSIILKKVEVPLVASNTCEKNLQSTRLGPKFKLHDSFICAGGQTGKDTCKGDGGSPLVFPVEEDPDRYFLTGIVSWGIGCWENIPGVYVNVAKFRNWIDQQMRHHKFDTSTYQYRSQI